MDPFTEKLLARTQARKAALSSKREEVAKRSPAVNSPRPPLTDNNHAKPTTPIAPKPNRFTENKPKEKGTPTVVTTTTTTTTQFAGGTPKSVFFEKYSKQTSLKQKECFIELEDAKASLKSTKDEKTTQNHVDKPTKERKLSQKEELKENSLTNTMDSPSVKDRRAMFLKQVAVDSTPTKLNLTDKNNTTLEKNVGEKPIFASVKEQRESTSGGRFFNDPRNAEKNSSKPQEKKELPTKPPRSGSVTSMKSLEPEQYCIKDVPMKPPRTTTGPPSKPPRNLPVEAPPVEKPCGQPDEAPVNKVDEPPSSTVKRKAPSPPENEDTSKKMNVESTSQITSKSESGELTSKKSTVVVPKISEAEPTKQPVGVTSHKTPQKMVVTSSNVISTPPDTRKAPKRCENEITNDIPKKKSAPETPQKEHLVVTESPKVIKESTPTHDKPIGDLKRALKSQKISAIRLDDVETNNHEITFNISMSEFDQQLDKEKESMFQMTYDERIKKTTTDQSDVFVDHTETNNTTQAIHKGSHKSGYHSAFSDQYKAVVTPKKVKAPVTRQHTVHEKIQILLEQAAYQQNIVLQASQAVNTCLALHDGVSTGASEEVEAERLLKFSTERRTACLDDVQKLKNEEENGVVITTEDCAEPSCKATLTISSIKIPVEKKLLQCKNSLEPCIFNFICMVKYNSKQMYCTKAVSSDEIKNNCIEFNDKFEISSVEPSFSLDIRVYQLKTQIQLATPNAKHKRKNIISKKKCDSVSQAMTPGTPSGPVFRTSNFTLVSTAVVNLDNVHRRKHAMTQVADESYFTGNIETDISCRPEYMNEAKGFLTVFEDVGGLGDWHRYWCMLNGSVLKYWKYPDDELLKPILGSINLGYCVSDAVTIVPRDICARPHTMQLLLEKPVSTRDRETLIAVNTGGKMQIKYMLSADTKDDKQTWMTALNESLKDWRAWHSSATETTNKKSSSSSETDVVMV